jgi:hypothetical protein
LFSFFNLISIYFCSADLKAKESKLEEDSKKFNEPFYNDLSDAERQLKHLKEEREMNSLKYFYLIKFIK